MGESDTITGLGISFFYRSDPKSSVRKLKTYMRDCIKLKKSSAKDVDD